MTVRRTVGVALAAFALLLLARPPRPTGLIHDDVPQRKLSPLNRARNANSATLDSLSVVSYAIWSRRLRDSVERQLAGMPPSARNRIVIDPRVPAPVRQHLTAVYAATRARLPEGATALPVFVVLDSAAREYRLGTMLWVESAQHGVASCATVLRIRISDEAQRDEGKRIREINRVLGGSFPQPRDFGLCGFEAAFGVPSPAVRRWLREREYQPVASGYEPGAAPRRNPRYFAGNFFPYWGSTDNSRQALAMRACSAGRDAYCVDALAPASDRAMMGDDAIPSDVRWFGWRWSGSPNTMNALVASLGAERFGTLWRGEQAPPAAYQRLTGVPIDTLARRVLLGSGAGISAGATVSPGEVIAVLLIAGVFAGLATLTHPRRRKA